MTKTDMEETNDLSPTPNVEKNVSLSPPTSVNAQNNVPLIINQANDYGDLITIDQPKKHSLAEKLKSSSNKIVNVTSPNPVKPQSCPRQPRLNHHLQDLRTHPTRL
jgi:hypothetical protein